MNLVYNNNSTITSVEVAELTGKRHDNILRDIRDIEQDFDSSNLRSEISSLWKKATLLPPYKKGKLTASHQIRQRIKIKGY